MEYDYRAKTAHFDPSILGINQHDWAVMDEEERAVFIKDALHRASDLCGEIVRAFQADLNSSERSEITQVARKLSNLARSRD